LAALVFTTNPAQANEAAAATTQIAGAVAPQSAATGDREFSELFASWKSIDTSGGIVTAAPQIAAVSVPAGMPLHDATLTSDYGMRTHPVLGHTTATPTMLDAGVSRNVTPPVATAILDVRSTPDWTHEEIADLLRARLDSEVVVTSKRLVPCETPRGSPLLAAARRARPEAAQFGSPTCSDWVFLRHVDAIKAGPGTSRRSHTPDECVDLPEVTAARRFYGMAAREYLDGGDR
jgi:acetylornithine deacetylase/succinyl-diaminopimelate desuccinylase-like protein